MMLRWISESTSPEVQSAGLLAARHVFKLAGLDPLVARSAQQQLDARSSTSLDHELEPSPAMVRAAAVWRNATRAAQDACGLGRLTVRDELAALEG